MNVRQKLLGGYLLVALLVGVTGGIASYSAGVAAEQASTTEALRIAEDVALGLPSGARDGMISPLYYSPRALENYLYRLRETHHRDVVVVDRNEYTLGDPIPENVGKPYARNPTGEVSRTIRDGRFRFFVEQTSTGDRRQVVVPLQSNIGIVIGAVIVDYTPIHHQMVAITGRAQRVTLISAGVVFLMVVALGVGLSRSLVRRITNLTDAVRIIRTGDYSHRVPSAGRDEVGELARAVNSMAEQLERSAREILAKEYTDSILAGAGEGICGVDPDGRIVFANETAGRITGLGVDGLLGRQADVLFPDSVGWQTTGASAGDLRHADGSEVHVEYLVNELEKEGRPIGAVVLLRDVTRQRELERDLRHQALHDGLTGLPNRKLMLERLSEALLRGRAGTDPVALFYLDLDGFKRVNDSLGHNAGDQLLRTAAQRLTAALRPQDTVARLGGDEFAVLLEGAGAAVVEELARGCLEALARPFVVQGREAIVTVSIGVVPEAARFTDADEVIRNADMAMYAAKDLGKNRFMVFESRMHEQLLSRLDQENRLRAAVHRGELRLHLQPVVALPDRRVSGAEALVRWQDPERGLQQPGSFIPLAEETGMIIEIDRWILLEACRTIRSWQEENPATAPAWVSVNLSAIHLDLPDLADHVAYALAATGLSPHCLVLELTETVLMRDLAVTSARLDELRQLGVKIAIDDFGTGYSSLGYLRDIPVDVLKIDRSFITGLVGNARQQELVSAIMQLGHTLGLRVVAEGVEDADQLALLTAMGCKFAQGYHLGRPQPPDELRSGHTVPVLHP